VDLLTIGDKLKVDNILEGSVRNDGNKLRISAQLIKVDDDTHLWSENYNRELKDVFDIQEEISQAIVKNLRVAILGGEDECLVKDYTKNTEAYELYLKGIFYFNKGFLDFEKAIECMQKAIKADPDYVPAYAFISHIIGVKTFFGLLPPREAKRIKVPLIKRALELDDKYGSTYIQLGMHKTIEDYDWHGAERDFKRALELNPGDSSSHNIYSYYLASVGLIDEAIEEAKRALELDPLESFYRFILVWLMAFDGQVDRAIEISQGTRELDPNNAWALYGLAMISAGKGKYDEGISMLQQFRNIPLITAYLGYLYGKTGNIEEAQKILDDFLARSKREYFSPFMIATVYAGMAEKDKVFEWLDNAFEARDVSQIFIRVHLPFADLHSDSRWMEQMKKRGLAD
jgi:tetratricopeptide (TPR) repeat protein